MLTLVPGELGGSETYARALARALATRRTTDVTAFVPSIAQDAGEGLPTEVVTEYRAATTMTGRLRAMVTAAASPSRLRLRFQGIDVVHYPLTVPVPPLNVPTAITLHDVQHLDLPRMFSRAERSFRKLAYDRAARRADTVLVPSAFVRERAIERLGLDPDRVRAIHHGVDHELFRPGGEVRERFLLYPAKTWPHKNHARLLDAFAVLRSSQPDLRLVLTGAGTERLAGPAGIDARGPVPLTELAELYRRAACVVFPSLYEGFGSPPLEAMASGTPVAASNRASLPEVCGDAAVLFDPESPEAIAAGVVQALDDAASLSERGLRHAASFTWERAALRHEDAYRATAQ